MTERTTGSLPRRPARYQLDSAVGAQTPAERAAKGKAARAEVPRTSHAVFDPPSDRPDPLAQLAEQAKTRVPELVPIRWGRMIVSPFTYYRGAALPMASDLASHARVRAGRAGLRRRAISSNFGIFGSAERRLMFDVNDFDETLPGPWEWDVKRLAASLEVAGRDNSFTDVQRREIVTAAVTRYRQAIRDFAGMTNLGVWYAHVDVDQLRAELGTQLKQRQRKLIDKGVAKARTRDSMQEVAKLTQVVDGRPRIIADPPLLVPLADLAEEGGRRDFRAELTALVGQYRRTLETDRRFLLDQYEVVDVARKVVGVGSVGTRCWIVLMLGRDDSDPLFLQVKEAEASVLSRFAGASKYANQGQRVVAGQRLMQASTAISSWAGSGSRRGWTARDAISMSGSCGTGNSPSTSRP